ncbi:MAG: bifunctional folylpolyglutamate synthase/dihydrofolate synthase [Chloroflexus sp.]|uniref:bifunctional folylpolyglutamate synthase/dihydrofolate synthase n=1 Tax=Chloroflexus sp. TaxID=1904827 RepID=UPI0021DC6218|nr:folylpolyglutamate synthase/dihydrofolate synthase family protein [Chloroflexus sp.]GIV87696.1 MAG: bifunctional folylpolyglutamate synthase/dihydrofolate synthase [Chloroflexus sp.]
MSITTYQAALDYIYSFIDPTRQGSPDPSIAQRGLDRITALLHDAGNPHQQLRAVVVAGTKGKGSTCVMIEAMARAAGLKVGLWTSPHLSSYRERIQIDREPISQQQLIELVNAVLPVVEGFDVATYGRPSTFDIGFVMAMRHFVVEQVDLAVVEVGLGGRYDAAATITPLVAVISSISYDHMAILGPTLDKIAFNKAGIIRSGQPAISVPQQADAAEVIAAEAQMVGAPLWLAAEAAVEPWVGTTTRLAYPAPPQPAKLHGVFQRENARLAMGATLLLRRQGIPITDDAIRRGLAEAWWPGRFEVIDGPPRILIDGAHNGDSAAKLWQAIEQELPHRRFILVLGTSRDKDIAAIAAALAPHADHIIITRSSHPKAMDLDRIAAEVEPFASAPMTIVPVVAEAIATARTLAGPDDLICVTGSLFVAGAAREALGLAVAD